METIILIKNLINELEQAKTKINKLKMKLATKELDIMNLKKEHIYLLMEVEELKLKEEAACQENIYQDSVTHELDQEHMSQFEVNPLFVNNFDNNQLAVHRITDSLLLNRRNRLKSVDKNMLPKKPSSGISKSIIMNQRNNLKTVAPLAKPKYMEPVYNKSDNSVATAIMAKRNYYENDDINNVLTDSWL